MAGLPILAGCGGPVDFTPAAHRSPEQERSSAPEEVEVESSFFGRSTDGRHVALPGAAPSGLVFSTPHLDGRIGEIYSGQVLPYDVATHLDRMNPLRAPEGHRFVAFTARAGRPAFEEDVEHPVEAFLEVDGSPLPLRNLFGGYSRGAYGVDWELVVACVRDGGRVVLGVTDEGRTVRVDLSAGTPVDDDAWVANEGFRERRVVAFEPGSATYERAFTTAPPEGIERENGELELGLAPDNAFLAPWNPVHGWAPVGRMWLTIPMHATVAFRELPAVVELDLQASFEYRSATGEPAPLVAPLTVSTEEVRRQRADIIPTFEVDGWEDTATLTFDAVGRATVQYTELQVPATLTGGSTPVRFALTLSDGPDRF